MILLQLETHKINGNPNPKDYPYKDELIKLLGDDVYIINEILPIEKIKELIHKADKIICIDSFLQHLCWYIGKQAIVLWGQSDPEIFGHKENINLLKDRKYLRENQFWLWSQTPIIKDAFIKPIEIIKYGNN